MSNDMKGISARQLIEMIAYDYYELSHDKIKLQRDDYLRWCQNWLQANPDKSPMQQVREAWAKRKEIGE